MLLEPKPGCVLRIRLRFLQLQARTPARRRPAVHSRFEEGVPRQVDATVALDDLLAGEQTIPIELPASREVDGPFRRECWPLRGRVLVSAVDLPGPYLVHRLRLDVVNDGVCPPGAPREEVLRTSLIAAHTVLAAEPGAWVSMTDPPRWAQPFVDECTIRAHLAGARGPADRSDLLLSSPIILHDHPQLAPESTINLFDGLENDEILTLRTLTLTDEEKAEARATDPRAAGIIDAVDAMPPEILERLHGAIRSLRPVGADSPAEQPPERLPWWDPGQDDTVDPDTDSVLVGATPVAKGSRVVLRPGRGGDVQDRFLDGASATVHAVVHDVDGGVHVAVSVDGDPAAELQIAHGRFRYFRPDELEARASMKVLVAGIGNTFLSDDGFGVEVIARLRDRELPDGVELVDTGIRGMHLAYQLLDGYDVLVLVDAVARGSDPGTLYVLEHDLDAPHERRRVRRARHGPGRRARPARRPRLGDGAGPAGGSGAGGRV